MNKQCFYKNVFLMFILVIVMSMLMGCSFSLFDEQPAISEASGENEEIEKIAVDKPEPTYNNNGNLFVEYNGDIYFREYTATSKEATALWANYMYADDETKMFKRRLKDGTVEDLFEDNGFGRFYIIDDMLFGTDELGLYYNSLTGKDFMPLGNGVQYVKADEKNHRLYYLNNYGSGNVYYIDTLTLETKEFCDQVIDTFIDIIDDNVYYFKSYEDKENEINVMKYNTKTKENTTIATLVDGRIEEEAEYSFSNQCEVGSFAISNNKLYVVVGNRQGTAMIFGESKLYEVDLSKEKQTLLKSGVDSEIVLNGDKLYFSDLVYEYPDENYYHSMNINTKKISDEESTCQYFRAKDGMLVGTKDDSSLILTEKDGTKKVIFSSDDKSRIEEKYLSEYEEEERLVEIINVNILPDYIFYEIQVSVTNPETDIGWRLGYRHIASEIHYYNLENNKDTLLYSYEVEQ